MLNIKDHGDKESSENRKSWEEERSLLLGILWNEVYTAGSQNTVFPGCLKWNIPRWPTSHRSKKKGTNILFLPSGYFMIDSQFIFFPSWGCSISFVCYIFVVNDLLHKIPYSYKVSLDENKMRRNWSPL